MVDSEMQMENQTEKPQEERLLHEIDVTNIILTLWARRRFIFLCTVIVSCLGLIYAFLATPIYHAEAIIAPKESQKNSNASGLLSQFGGFGGVVASQLGLGNTNLNRLEILVQGYELVENVILENNLLPVLFPDAWNSVTGRWKDPDSANAPQVRDGIEKIRKRILQVSVDDKKNMLIIGINFTDAVTAKKLVEFFLTALNKKIQGDVHADAESNMKFLNEQLEHTADPLLREKIQTMISGELEKFMLVSSQSFDVLEKPVVPLKRISPKRKLLLMVSLCLGLSIGITGTYVRLFSRTLMAEIVARTRF